MITGLHHVAIAVHDIDATAAFYCTTFGLPGIEASETLPDQGVRAAFIPLGNCRIEEYEPEERRAALGEGDASGRRELRHLRELAALQVHHLEILGARAGPQRVARDEEEPGVGQARADLARRLQPQPIAHHRINQDQAPIDRHLDQT